MNALKTTRRYIAVLLTFALLLGGAWPVGTAAGAPSLPEGEYDVPFLYLKDGSNDTSAAHHFMVADSGKLIIEEGQAFFEHEVSNRNYATFAYFASRQDGAPKAVISSSGGETIITGRDGYTQAVVRAAANPEHTVLRLEIIDPAQKQDILMHIYDEDNIYQLPSPYNNWYNTQLQLDLSGIDVPGSGPIDKSHLIAWIATASEWAATAKDYGETATGSPGNPNAVPVSDGEYPVDTSQRPITGPATKVRTAINEAQAIVDDPAATQADISAKYNELVHAFDWEDLEKQKYTASTVKLLVLDSLEAVAQLSPHADDFGSEAVILQQAADPYYAAYANITFVDPEDKLGAADIQQVTLQAADGFFGNYTSARAKPVASGEPDGHKVYQAYIRSNNATYPQTDELWQGLFKLKYPVTAPVEEQKEVFLSFNAAYLETLQTLVEETQELHDQAAEADYPAAAFTALNTAIETARTTAGMLAAPRPQLLQAAAALQTAVDAFEDARITDPNPGPGPGPGPGPAPTNPVYPADGTYLMPFSILKQGSSQTSVANDYVVSPALVRVNGGSKSVSFTVKRSAEITGLTLNGSSGTVSSTNTSANTRVVTYTLSDLSGNIPGWVKIDWAEHNYHYDYNIQFSFNEGGATYAGSGAAVPGSDGHTPPPPLTLPGDTNGRNGNPVKEEDANEDGNENDTENDNANDNENTNGNEPSAPGPTDQSGGEQRTIQFSDTMTHWARASIERAVTLDIVNGYTDGSFRPNAVATRGEFAVMISRALNLASHTADTRFSDADAIPAWARDHVARAVAAGIINGFDNGTFRSDGQLTRAQLAVIIARAAGLTPEEDGTPAIASYADASDVPAWASNELAAAVTAGLLQGQSGNRLAPNATATRAEALTLIIRLLDWLDVNNAANAG
ncbi:S-layer homology domain-containing protein [Paenibacillus sp. 1P07SE]|uniref:S-layer homology domain-containing protein n=1 Tax=Paenibacillus sp. 1P07SE TaxID=3132209 RepID=UPI0039A56425